MQPLPPDAVVDGAPPPNTLCDLLVVGSGASGLATAVSARKRGLNVIVVEKAAQFGGTTVSSAGVIWIPNSRQARAAGIDDSKAAVLNYLQALGGNRLDGAKAETYASEAAGILEWYETNTYIDYALAPAWPDYHPDEPGGSKGGRSLGPRPFDGRTLGRILSGCGHRWPRR